MLVDELAKVHVTSAEYVATKGHDITIDCPRVTKVMSGGGDVSDTEMHSYVK